MVSCRVFSATCKRFWHYYVTIIHTQKEACWKSNVVIIANGKVTAFTYLNMCHEAFYHILIICISYIDKGVVYRDFNSCICNIVYCLLMGNFFASRSWCGRGPLPQPPIISSTGHLKSYTSHHTSILAVLPSSCNLRLFSLSLWSTACFLHLHHSFLIFLCFESLFFAKC